MKPWWNYRLARNGRSVLVERMLAEKDFDVIEPRFYSTSQAGSEGPNIGRRLRRWRTHEDRCLARLRYPGELSGGSYTKEFHPKLRASGWRGYWIDAASALRMDPGAVIILDPVNRSVIDDALASGIRTTSVATAR